MHAAECPEHPRPRREGGEAVSYVNHGIAWTHLRLARATRARSASDARPASTLTTSSRPTGTVSRRRARRRHPMEVAIRMVRARLATPGWDVSPDDEPLSADLPPCVLAGIELEALR